MGFAAKSFSGDEDFMACYSQTHTPHECDKGSRKPEDSFGDDSASISTEMDGTSTSSFCYNIRHMERHGRELQDPWSCRQTAIHQTIWHHSRTTRTILIQPPKSLDKSFTHGVSMNVSHPMNLHLRLLKTGLAEWREYLNYLSTNIKELDMHIAICKPYGEFGLDLSSKQRVHSLRRKLYHARSILSKMRAMIMKMKTHEQKTAKLCKLSLDTQELFQSDLSNILVEVENHLQTIRKLLSMTYDIKSMYTDIIHLASQDLIHQNAIKLSEIAEMDSRENKIMISISNKMYRDSRTMRIATVVAMLYLPANLVLVSTSVALSD
ncbi:hypothetical protein F5Y16DRAFT_352757 [Xylariaceae sp. FL0255]|nr:hypothetical protein F5Y16DRAFT_352757 [Xylariaceae sp. FL0255]